MKRRGGGVANLNSGQALNNDNSAQNSAPNLSQTATISTNSTNLNENSNVANTPNSATPSDVNLNAANSSTPTSGATLLDATNVTATLGDAQRPGAVTTREGVNTSTQSIDQILRTMPGSYTQLDASQGTVQVNIRGLTGMGRVNTMIDGVPQTFFGTSADLAASQNQGNHYGVKISGTQAFGATIDQNLIADIDMTRGTFSGASGANGLMGSANFRTLGIQDIIEGENNAGIITKYSYGSQKIGPSFMGGVALRSRFENGGYVGAMFAYSGANMQQEFGIGTHRLGTGTAGTTGNAAENLPGFIKQKPRTTLIKLETMPNGEHFIGTNFRFYNNYLAGRKLDLDSYQINYRFKPESALIDTRMLVAYMINKETYDDTARKFLYSQGGNNLNKALNLDLSNTFNFMLSENINYTFTPGFTLMNNDYKVTDNPVNAAVGTVSTTTSRFLPQGKQEFYSVYIDQSYMQGILGLNANVNLTHYKLKGKKPALPTMDPNDPRQLENDNYLIDNKKTKSYINASLIASLEFHTLFAPFISYTRANRVPSPQEAFYISSWEETITYPPPTQPNQQARPPLTRKNYNANPDLKNEVANTYQVGFNSFQEGLLNEDDYFGFKALYYHTDIKNFIYVQNSLVGLRHFLEYKNGEAKFKGFEVETSYDLGFAYARATYTHQENDYGKVDFGGRFITHDVKLSQSFTKPPKDVATLDLGARFFDKSLVLGSIIKYSGKAEKVKFDRLASTEMVTSYEALPQIPTIVDLYANYKPIRNLEFKLEVQNVFNEKYVDSLEQYINNNTIDAPSPRFAMDNKSRGRTFIGSFVFRY